MESINILWFKKDLRVINNEALYKASKELDILPIYIIEKEQWAQKAYSDRQWQFCKECLLELRQELELLGQPLIIRTGNVIDVFEEIAENFKINAIYSHQETGDFYSFNRDKKVKVWASKKNILWKEFLQFAVFRGKLDRDKWSKKWKEHIEKEIPKFELKLNPIKTNIGDIPEDNFFRFKKDPCKGRLKGGRKEGLIKLNSFFSQRINFYSKNISNPDKSFDTCSRLSPYITWGCISLREIFDKSKNFKHKDSQMFKSRLTWHCHFIQKLESEPELEFKDFHPYFDNTRVRNKYLLNLWSKGETGFPFIDACMRSLNYNGWINFRMRAMLMSFASYNLWLPWQDSGLLLAQKFVDYEPGIHWCQCQMQSGTTSINTNRIYNPIKQGKDHDPKGTFIKKWVPELINIPTTFIHEPWLMNNLSDLGELKNTNYIKPIVNIIESSRDARRKIGQITRKEGYGDISKIIYRKHGSRKNNLKRRTTSKSKVKTIKSKVEDTQLSLNIIY